MPRSTAARALARPATGTPTTVPVGQVLGAYGLADAVGRLTPSTLRARMPVPLLTDPARATAVRAATYATVEGIQRRQRRASAAQPCTWGVAAIGEHLGLTRSPVERALSWLGAQNWLESQQIGRGRTARRWVRAGVPFVDVPLWTLDLIPAVIDPGQWRLYAVYLHRRHEEHGWTVTDTRAQIAALIGTTPAKVTAGDRGLQAGGLILSIQRPPKPTLIIPLIKKTGSEQRERAAEALRAQALRLSTTPLRSEGPTSHEDATSPRTDGATPLQSDGATPPRSEGDTGFSELVLSHLPFSSEQSPVPCETRWCGRCIAPHDRRLMDEFTGFPAAPCPRCGTPRRALTAL